MLCRPRSARSARVIRAYRPAATCAPRCLARATASCPTPHSSWVWRARRKSPRSCCSRASRACWPAPSRWPRANTSPCVLSASCTNTRSRSTRRARGKPARGTGRARTDLLGARPHQTAGRRGGRGDHEGPRAGPGHPRTRRTRSQSRRARLAVGRGRVVVRRLRRRRRRAAAAVSVRRWHEPIERHRRGHRHRLVRRRRDLEPVHRQRRVVEWLAHGVDRRRRGLGDVCGGAAVRRWGGGVGGGGGGVWGGGGGWVGCWGCCVFCKKEKEEKEEEEGGQRR